MIRTVKFSICRVVFLFAFAVCVSLFSSGCIRTQVHITTDPSDAKVTVNYIERGYSPIEMPILWYWYYKIRIEKDGYEPIEADERFKAPPWAWWPLDLFAEIIPVPIKKTYVRHYVLKPKESD